MAQPKADDNDNDNDDNIDVGGFAPAKHYCPHISAAKLLNKVNEFPNINEFPECDISDCTFKENWICLKCYKVFCGRYGNQHMIKHYETNTNKKHCIAMGVGDLSFWCYKCNDYLHHLSIKKIFKIYEMAHIKKFGHEIPQKLKKECDFDHFDDDDDVDDDEEEEEEEQNDDVINNNIKGRNPQNNPLTRSGANRGLGYVESGKDTVLEEDQKEYFDSNELLLSKAKKVAQLISASKYTVLHTGAGISTSANLPDYRGPNGVWTLKAKGKNVKSSAKLEDALPTYTHMALYYLFKHNLLHYVVSTNVDGLHLKSGILLKHLAELHGNVYMEYCNQCGKEYYRDYNVQNLQQNIATIASVFTRFTGRRCEENQCGGKLRDSIVSFGENLPQKELTKSTMNSCEADLNIVIGSSMRVQPACQLPLKGEKFVLINLQKTPYDDNADVRVWAKCDEFIKMVMDELKINVKPYDDDHINEIKKLKEKQEEEEEKKNDVKPVPTKNFEETLSAVDKMEKNFENMIDGFTKVTNDLNNVIQESLNKNNDGNNDNNNDNNNNYAQYYQN